MGLHKWIYFFIAIFIKSYIDEETEKKASLK
jgi:hypothetical protein